MSRTRFSRLAVVCALLPLVPPDPLFALPPAVGALIMGLGRLLLLLLVNLDQPLIITVLVLSLVTPLGNPLALFVIVDQFAVALLILDALLGSKALPLGRLLGGGYGLFAG